MLVVGFGASGKDIGFQLSKIAKSVTYSMHKRPNETPAERERRKKEYGKNVTFKNNVTRFTKNAAHFDDGSQKNVTHVIFATGDLKFSTDILFKGNTFNDNILKIL